MVQGLKPPKPGRNYWRDCPDSGSTAIRNVTPQLFIVCMGTGVLSALLHNNPYQFKGLEIISIIVWILDILIFSSIAIAFITRWIKYPGETAKMFSHDIEQTSYLSSTTVAAATIAEMLVLVCASRWNNWQYAAFAIWWLIVVMSLISASASYWLLIRDETVSIDNLSPTLMYPVTGLLATALTGSILVGYSPLSTTLSMSVIVVSYLLLGAGFILAIMTMSSFFLRLLHNSTPPAKKVAAQLIPLAPFSNASYTFATLGYLAGPKKHVFEYYGKGPVSDPAFGNAIYATGVVLALAIWGFATLWLIIATVAFVRDIPKTKFNLNMWSAAYPYGTYGIACSSFATDFDSVAFKVITTIILITLVILWLYLVFATIPLLISGELFLGEAMEDMEKHKEKHGEKQDEQGSGRRARSSDEETAV